MTLKIEAGKFYRSRDGRKVGPMVRYDHELLHCEIDQKVRLFRIASGKHHYDKADLDLIAEWTDEPAATPEVGTPDVAKAMHEAIYGAPEQTLLYGHARLPSGEVVDLTAITTPFGLLPADVQQALRDHGGPWEAWQVEGYWEYVTPGWGLAVTYRVRPQPSGPKVEEVGLHGGKYSKTMWDFESVDASKSWHTHRITFNLIDGKPDTSSIRMEAL